MREKKRHKKVTGKHLFFRCFLFVQLFYLQGKEVKQGIIISHVAELKERIDKRIEVAKMPDGGSVVRIVLWEE